MVQYIDKFALVAEIDRQIELLKPFLGACAGQIVAEANDKLSVLEKLKNFLDTLEVKKVDLEKELDKEWNKCEPIDEGMGLETALIEHEQFDTIAKHFFELGLKASNPLTWKDIKILQEKSSEVFAEVAKGKVDFYSIYPTEQSFLEEVLKRFKAQKGE